METKHTPEVSPRDIAILRCMGDARSIATHWMCNAAGFPNDTARTRRALKSMERRGLVEGVPSSRSGLVFWWAATSAGLAAIAKAEGA